jgi:hypothetical protein
MQLEELLDWYIGPQLRMVPGIVEVNSFGGEDRQYQVMLDPARLQATGVSVAQVVEALQKSNANAGGGYIEHNREHFVIGTDGLVTSLEDLRASSSARRRRACPSPSRRSATCASAPAAARRATRTARARSSSAWPDADGRELAHRHRGGQGEAGSHRTDPARRAPASSPSTTARCW